MPPDPGIPASGLQPSLRPYRMGQVFSGANAFTWMVALGAPLTLLAEKLGGTTFQVGLLYAFILVLTPVQVISTALLPRFGYKAIATSMFAARSVFLLVPLGLALYAPDRPEAWTIHALTVSIFMFSLLRSVGVCAILPWIMFFTAFQYAGTVTGSHFARLWLDRWGVRPFFLVGVGIHCLVVAYILLVVVAGGIWASFAGVAFFLAGVSFSSFFTAHFKYIPQLTDEDDRPLALNLQGAISGLIAGLTTIGVGALLKNASGAVDQGRYIWAIEGHLRTKPAENLARDSPN